MTDENNQIKFFLYENWARTKTGQHTVVHYNSVIMNNSVRPKALIIGHSFVRRLKDDLLRNFDSRASLDFGVDRSMEVLLWVYPLDLYAMCF